MAVEIHVVYEGDLRCRAQHGPSGVVLKTDAPVYNQGKGEHFSPGDLVAAALGSCMMTVMGTLAKRHGYPIEGSKIDVLKEVVEEPVQRIGQLTVSVHIANSGCLQEKDRKILQQAAHACVVMRSLNPDIKVPVTFHWE